MVSESSRGAGRGCWDDAWAGGMCWLALLGAPRLGWHPGCWVARDSWASRETRQRSALAKTAIWEQLDVLSLPSWPCHQRG